MAKKRKKVKEEKEKYEYIPPEFEEEEFLRKEVRETKTLLVTVGYAALIGIASFGLTFTDAALGALLGIVAVVFLRHIYPLIRIDTSQIEKKQWAGNIIMYFFTWLAIWILLTNPPFSDSAGPTVKSVGVYFESSPGMWTLHNESNNITVGMNVSINATIRDNVKVDRDTIRIFLKANDVEITPVGGASMTNSKEDRYFYGFSPQDIGRYEYEIKAKDVNDNPVSKTGVFNVN
ncbi:MAG: hypothetical protein JSW28_08795 [Thermoplasmata archaeon]|nr:MAG: hypothetical protein JSW28_08795 [Thermoplasmata archaeon]